MMKSYRGGHGWVPFTVYADRIKEAMEWFRAGTGLDGEQRKNNPKMPGANK